MDKYATILFSSAVDNFRSTPAVARIDADAAMRKMALGLQQFCAGVKQAVGSRDTHATLLFDTAIQNFHAAQVPTIGMSRADIIGRIMLGLQQFGAGANRSL